MKFLTHIQESDEQVKRKWIVVFSILSLLVVLYLWNLYFSNVVVASATTDTPQAGGFSFFESVRSGGAVALEIGREYLASFEKLLIHSREVQVKASP